MGWAQSKLSIRQAGYAITALVVVASLFSIFGAFQFYAAERNRQTTNLRQQVDMISSAAARAAFHVDDIQARAILEGLFRFENLEWARITTDRGVVLSERDRTFPPTFADPLARLLFSDTSSHVGHLSVPGTGSVGSIELRTSPEMVGRDFLDGIATLFAGLVVQFVLLGVTLVVIFHRTLTRPLLRYADAVSRLGTAGVNQPLLEVPKGHESDEFGIVVRSTNQLLERIKIQHRDLLHREKVAALGTLLAGVSHELNNPLAILVAQCELLVETAGDANTRNRGEKMLAMTNRCVVIVRRFLALARRRDIERETLDIGGTISEVMEILDYQLEQGGVETTVTVPPVLPPMLADPSQITQILLNLVTNAQQALTARNEGRQIAIDVDFIQEDAVIRITVADNGPGIAAENPEQIFEPFYTTKSEGQGTGLGLSYSRDVAQNHGGRLALGASQLGGAAFILTLPAAAEGETEPEV
jgi:signal transduction histidine kinase